MNSVPTIARPENTREWILPFSQATTASETDDGYSTAEVWEVFRLEVAQHVATMRRLLQKLETSPAAPNTLLELRRVIHTLKGTAGSMGFPHLAQLAHRMEDSLCGSTINPILHEMLAVLEELSGGIHDSVALNPLPTLKSLTALEPRLRQTAKHAARLSRKQVHLVIELAAVELDSELWNELDEILLHLLRNAIDHGIETPSLRRQQPKPETGLILIKGFCKNGQLTIQVIDDGSGLDTDAIRRTAVDRGMISCEQANHFTSEQLFALLVKPGFSTARQLSELSGRGLGFDIVNTRIHNRHGYLLLDSEPNRGTCIALSIPIAGHGSC